MPIRNATKWYPPSGKGYVLTQGTLLFTNNSGTFIVTNSGNNIVTTPTYTRPEYATAWTATGV